MGWDDIGNFGKTLNYIPNMFYLMNPLTCQQDNIWLDLGK